MSSEHPRFKSLKEFWPYYLGEHSDARNRSMHFFGTTLVITVAAAAIATRHWNWLLTLPVCGYAFAWAGHFFIEGNTPATFRNPFYSLACDFIMFGYMLTGRLPGEVEKYCRRK